MPFRKSAEQLQEQAWEALQLGEYARALKLGQRLHKLRHSSNFELRALAHRGREESDLAIHALREGTQYTPEFYEIWLLLGSTLSDADRYDEALEAYDQAAQCEGALPAAVAYNRAIVLWKMARHPEALALCEPAYADTDVELQAGLLFVRMETLLELNRHAEVLALQGELERLIAAAAVPGPADGMLLIDGSGLYFERVGREYLARCTVGLLRAKQKEGAPQEELLALARKAIKLHDFCDSAQNWLREIRNEHSPDARCHRIIITGEFRPDGSSANLGFYRNYTVLATNLDQAVNYIREFEDEEFTVDESKTLPEPHEPTKPLGVYYLSGYMTYPIGK